MNGDYVLSNPGARAHIYALVLPVRFALIVSLSFATPCRRIASLSKISLVRVVQQGGSGVGLAGVALAYCEWRPQAPAMHDAIFDC